MKIYISEDHLNENARKTKESLVEISNELE